MNIGSHAYHPHTPLDGLTSFAKPLARVFLRAIFQMTRLSLAARQADCEAICFGFRRDELDCFRLLRDATRGGGIKRLVKW